MIDQMTTFPELFYIEDGCHKYTFDAKKVKAFVKDNLEGEKILNLFAGKNIIHYSSVRVDLDPKAPRLTHNIGAEDFLVQAIDKDWKFDTIIYDPPWNERKSKEFYEGRFIGRFTKLKNAIVDILEPNGIVISVGYEITNFGKLRGMQLEKMATVNPSGEIRPYFISIERKISDKQLDLIIAHRKDHGKVEEFFL